MQDQTGETGKEAAIGFSYTAAVGDGRQVVLQSFVAQSDGIEVLHKQLDVVRQAVDRQMLYGKIESIENEIELKHRLVGQLEEGIANVDSLVASRKQNERGRQGLLPQEQTQRDNAMKSLASEKKSIDNLTAKRDALRASLKG